MDWKDYVRETVQFNIHSDKYVMRLDLLVGMKQIDARKELDRGDRLHADAAREELLKRLETYAVENGLSLEEDKLMNLGHYPAYEPPHWAHAN